MADVASGIETVDESVDPNSDAGFAQSLASAVGGEITPEQAQSLNEGERSIESGLEVEEPGGQPRGLDGKFVAQTPAEEEPAEQTPPGEEEQPTPEEAEAERLLAGKYKTEEELERAYKELESRLGDPNDVSRQLAAMQAELQAVREAREERPQALPDLPVVSEEQMARLDGMVAQYGGVGTIQWLAENRPDLLDAGYEAWKATDDPMAEQAHTIYRTALATGAMHQPAAPAQPQRDPLLEELHMKRRIETALDGVKGAAPDWDQIKPHIHQSFTELPAYLQQDLVADDKTANDRAMFALVQSARVHAREKLAVHAAQAGDEGRAASVAAKQATALATGGLRQVAPAAAGGVPPADETPEQRSERVRAALHDALLNTETTDVREGLTFG
jgi:hypothetical protein